MSGALETAAGAFAVVGVADVLVRTGRELYSFLQDIQDAPEDITRLQNFIWETVLLYQTSKKCQNDLKARNASTDAVSSLETANKALNRELQSLRLSIGKFKGNKTWGRVKFVLGNARLNKTMGNLERAKNILASALTLACSELSALGLAETQASVQQSFRKVELDIGDLFRAHESKLDAHHQDVLAANTHCQQTLISKLDTNRQHLSAKIDSHQQIMSSVRRTQRDVLGRQDTMMRVATHTQRQMCTVLQTVNRADRRASRVSKSNMDSLDSIANDIKQLLSLKNSSAEAKQSGRDIFFLGPRQDQILAYLLPMKDDLNFAIDSLISQQSDEVAPSDAEWLRSEFKNLLGSAAQENALRYSDSTATPFDQWSYPEDTVGFMDSTTSKRKAHGSWESEVPRKKHARLRPEWLRNRPKQPQQIRSVPTASGSMEISLPNRRTSKKHPKGIAEVGLCYTLKQNHSSLEIRARFLRDLTYASRPRIYAQLNVFVVLGDDLDGVYFNLLQVGTLAQVDTALRNGTISPFHIDNRGDNSLLFWAVFYGRLDILDYLEDQGIGQTSLNHDSSLINGHMIEPIDWGATLVETTLRRANDVPSFALHQSLSLLLHRDGTNTGKYQQVLSICLKALREEWFDQTQNEWLLSCCSLRGLTLSCNSVPRLLLLLIEAGAPIQSKDAYGRNAIVAFLDNPRWSRYDHSTIIDILGILIEKGVDVNEACEDKLTPSMHARYEYRWDEWCAALERQNRKIDDVLRVEGNEWLLQDDWGSVWKGRKYCRWEQIDKRMALRNYGVDDSECSTYDEGSDWDDNEEEENEWNDDEEEDEESEEICELENEEPSGAPL